MGYLYEACDQISDFCHQYSMHSAISFNRQCRCFIVNHVFDFSQTFRGVNTDFFFNFSDIFLISPTSDPSDFLLNRAVHAVLHVFSYSKQDVIAFVNTVTQFIHRGSYAHIVTVVRKFS
jgi:hypothetical protein